MSANDKQVGGTHYRRGRGAQHWDWAQNKCYLVGAATKYLDRHDSTDVRKGGIRSIEKSIHYIQKLIERDYPEYELVWELRRKDGGDE